MSSKVRFRRSALILSAFEGSIISFKGPLIEDLVNKQYSVYILAPDFSIETKNSLIKMGVSPVDISLSRDSFNIFKDLVNLFRLVVLMRKIKPEIFLGYYIKPVIWGGIAAFLARVPKRIVMIEGLGHIFTDTGTKQSFKSIIIRKLISFLYRFSLMTSKFVFFLNNDDKAEFETRKIISKDKAVVLGGIGLKLSEWHCLAPIMDPINFLFVGRMVKEKGFGEFIQAAKALKTSYPNVSFTALGEPEKREKKFTLDYLKRLDKSGIVSCPGHVEVRKWFAECSVFVLPSYREGMPRSTQEAMALGKPVITTNAPGCRDTVVEGKNGFLIEIGDVESLINAMKKFILKPSIIATMGVQSRIMAEEKFDAHIVNERIFDLTKI
jgi:glycosyltransferase involved in cell wall biosynthesis